MTRSQIAAQMYTVRDFLKTPADIAASLKKLKAIGYQAVQLSGLGPIGNAEIVAMLKDNGLVCCATHEGSDTILNDPQAVVKKLKELGCTITAYPYPSGYSCNTLEEVKELAKRLNAAGKVLYDNGCVLCYHNHHIEFKRVGGKPAFQVLFEETDPRYLQGEPDTHWVQHGGGDPVWWCTYLKNRLPILHMKDFVINAETKISFAEIGYGNLDWQRIVAAAEQSGCKWFCVEQDTCPGDPFDSLKKSFNYLVEKICSA
jgi:sugar phosphate isomerase/epimerase